MLTNLSHMLTVFRRLNMKQRNKRIRQDRQWLTDYMEEITQDDFIPFDEIYRAYDMYRHPDNIEDLCRMLWAECMQEDIIEELDWYEHDRYHMEEDWYNDWGAYTDDYEEWERYQEDLHWTCPVRDTLKDWNEGWVSCNRVDDYYISKEQSTEEAWLEYEMDSWDGHDWEWEMEEEIAMWEASQPLPEFEPENLDDHHNRKK